MLAGDDLRGVESRSPSRPRLPEAKHRSSFATQQIFCTGLGDHGLGCALISAGKILDGDNGKRP